MRGTSTFVDQTAAQAGNSGYQRITPVGPTPADATITVDAPHMDVDLDVNTATDDYDVYLPNPALLKGAFITIRADVANSKTATLKTKGSPIGWSDLTFDTDEDNVVLYCTGRAYRVIYNGIV